MDQFWRASPALMAARLNRGHYKRYRHIDFIDSAITPAIINGGARFIVSVPPRHGKSWLISRYTPAWFLSLFPERNVILASYEANFAAGWGRQARNFIQEHSDHLGVKIMQDSHAADRWHTPQGGGMVTAGVGGAITGRGGHLLIIDDPVKNWDEAQSPILRERAIDWWNSTFYTRAEPNASIIILATRWHQRDLSGYLLSDENETHKDWTEIRLPALAEENDPMGRKVGEALCPERYDEYALNHTRRTIGSRAWAALYQQRPTEQEGNIVKREQIQFWDSLPPRMSDHMITVDATFTGKGTSDFVVMQAWARDGADKYLIDQIHRRMGINETLVALRDFCHRNPAHHLRLIENKANGPAIEDLLRRELSGLVLWEPKGDKVSRLNAVAPQFESGNVHFPLPARSNWVEDLIDELVTFPNAAHDDRVDALTMALLRFEEATYHPVGMMRVLR